MFIQWTARCTHPIPDWTLRAYAHIAHTYNTVGDILTWNDWRSIPYSLPVSSIQCHIHTQVVPWMGHATQLNMEHWVYTHLKQQALMIRRILNRHSVSCLRIHVAPWMDPCNTPEREHCVHTSNTTDNYVNWKNTVCMYMNVKWHEWDLHRQVHCHSHSQVRTYIAVLESSSLHTSGSMNRTK